MNIPVTGRRCTKCGTGNDLCTDGTLLARLCRRCLKEAMAESEAINKCIRAFAIRFGIPTFPVNELGAKELEKKAAQ